MSSASQLFSTRTRRSRGSMSSPNSSPAVAANHDLDPSRPRRRRCLTLPRPEQRLDASSDSRIANFCPNDGDQASASNNRIHDLGVDRNDRLPDAVLQARLRLLERLRGTLLTRIRQSRLASELDAFSIDGPSIGADSNNVDPEYMLWLQEVGPLHELATRLYQPRAYEGATQKRHGLSCQIMSSLKQEIFTCKEVHKDDNVHVSLDCSICLEMFLEGDDLVQLPCSHRFHHSCLVPWLSNRSDCPNCRALI